MYLVYKNNLTERGGEPTRCFGHDYRKKTAEREREVGVNETHHTLVYL